MTRLHSFDSIFIGTGIYTHVDDYNCERPSYIEHAMKFGYSKELAYLKEVSSYLEGWDSYNAKPPEKQSIKCSISFLSSFTNELRKSNIIISDFPEFYLAADGILGFEWDYAKNSNLFARMYSTDKIEYTLKENNNKQPSREVTSADFIEICKKKLQYTQVA